MASVWHRWNPFGRAVVWGLGVVALVASGIASAQQAPVQPNQLQAFISAVDANGAPVTDLKAEEIAMTENGVPGKVVSLERYNLPIKLTIAIDNGKESTPALATMREGLAGLIGALPADLEVALVTMAPQPSTFVRSTTDRGQLTKGISRFGVESDEAPRFSDALVEYADRLEKDFKDKKLTYAPMLVMVSTTVVENSDAQRDTIEKALKTLLTRGARVSVAMVTTKPTDADSVDGLKNGRQALVATPIVKASRGKFETMVAFSRLAAVLPEWGKDIAFSHARQTNQFRAVIDRPGGATGPLNNPGLRLTRPGINGSVSPDGRFVQ
ncbi:MAG TPA: hypothetical protein VKB50_27180 [Vicinamibacterales bacterium]|nr:hypothetical protein [Vicinamibacterales bacterium]